MTAQRATGCYWVRRGPVEAWEIMFFDPPSLSWMALGEADGIRDREIFEVDERQIVRSDQ